MASRLAMMALLLLPSLLLAAGGDVSVGTNATLRYVSGGVVAVLNASTPGMPIGPTAGDPKHDGRGRGGGVSRRRDCHSAAPPSQPLPIKQVFQ